MGRLGRNLPKPIRKYTFHELGYLRVYPNVKGIYRIPQFKPTDFREAMTEHKATIKTGIDSKDTARVIAHLMYWSAIRYLQFTMQVYINKSGELRGGVGFDVSGLTLEEMAEHVVDRELGALHRLSVEGLYSHFFSALKGITLDGFVKVKEARKEHAPFTLTNEDGGTMDNPAIYEDAPEPALTAKEIAAQFIDTDYRHSYDHERQTDVFEAYYRKYEEDEIVKATDAETLFEFAKWVHPRALVHPERSPGALKWAADVIEGRYAKMPKHLSSTFSTWRFYELILEEQRRITAEIAPRINEGWGIHLASNDEVLRDVDVNELKSLTLNDLHAVEEEMEASA
jgi:hypothetical protein